MTTKTKCICLVALILVAWLPPSARGQARADDTAASRVRLLLTDRPSLRVGRLLRVDLRARIQGDFRAFSPDLVTDEGTFDLNRARIALDGNFLRHFDYQVEHEFRETFGGLKSKYPWRDVYVNFDYFDNFQLQAGKFKIPFSVEQLTSVANLDFIERARVADDLAPARDIGVMLHGRFFQRGFGYEAGVFRSDGENSESHDNVRGKRTYALRLTGTPLRPLGLPLDLGKIEIGAAAVSTDVPEGLNSLRGRTNGGINFFPPLYVQGRRMRIGTEFRWQPGPLSIKSEWIHVSEARDRQSIRETDLPAKISRGWYVTAAWTVTGEPTEGGIEPRRPFPLKGGGAIQIQGRYEQLRFGGAEHAGVPFASPRAPNILGNSDRAWTAGISWYVNHFTKVQVNGIHETIEDVERSPIPGRDKYWMGIMRLQFSM
jgi:phosphate-selective porin OprO and OprP